MDGQAIDRVETIDRMRAKSSGAYGHRAFAGRQGWTQALQGAPPVGAPVERRGGDRTCSSRDRVPGKGGLFRQRDRVPGKGGIFGDTVPGNIQQTECITLGFTRMVQTKHSLKPTMNHQRQHYRLSHVSEKAVGGLFEEGLGTRNE